jgi:hypothetical protein
MSEYLTTTGVSYYLEKMIKKSNGKLYIITPYVDTARLVKNLLLYFNNKHTNPDFRFVYRENHNPKEMDFWEKRLNNVKIYRSDNIHAKVYVNQDTLIHCSMNLYEFSQQNNYETLA